MTDELTLPELRELLKSEYLKIQGTIDAFDGHMLRIKAWSVSSSLAAVAGAFISKQDIVLWVAALSSLVFWATEVLWKNFQYSYYDRAGKIEKYFEGKASAPAPLQIGASWYRHYRKGGWRRLRRIAMWPHVALPHAFILVLSLALFIASRSGMLFRA